MMHCNHPPPYLRVSKPGLYQGGLPEGPSPGPPVPCRKLNAPTTPALGFAGRVLYPQSRTPKSRYQRIHREEKKEKTRVQWTERKRRLGLEKRDSILFLSVTASIESKPRMSALLMQLVKLLGRVDKERGGKKRAVEV